MTGATLSGLLFTAGAGVYIGSAARVVVECFRGEGVQVAIRDRLNGLALGGLLVFASAVVDCVARLIQEGG